MNEQLSMDLIRAIYSITDLLQLMNKSLEEIEAQLARIADKP